MYIDGKMQINGKEKKDDTLKQLGGEMPTLRHGEMVV